MKIKNTKKIDQNKICFCVYGESGAGKTTLVGTLPGKVLMLSAEQGELPLKGKDVDYAPASSWQEITEFVEYTKTDECKKTYDWIVLDSVSEIGERCVEACEQKYKGESNKFALWDAYKKAMTRLIKYFRDSQDYHSLHIYQEDIREDDLGRRCKAFGLQGSLRSKVPYFYDIVLYMNVEKDSKTGKVSRKLITVDTKGAVAKDRSGALNSSEDPDVSAILKKVLN